MINLYSLLGIKPARSKM